MLAAAQKAREDSDAKCWKYEWKGETIILRDITDKIVNWVDRFKSVVQVGVSFDPVHAALPWMGFRFILEVFASETPLRDLAEDRTS